MKNIKAYIAECIGTFVLVFCACGVAAFTNGSIVPTALAFGLVIVAMAYSIGRISGCHINPAVSLAMLVAKKMSVKDFFCYVGAQFVGAFLGGVSVWGFARMGGIKFPAGAACNGPVGGTADVGGIFGALLVEIVLTFIFVYVIMNVTDSKNEGAGKKGGIIIGLTLTLVHLIGIPFTGTSVNPARSFGTALADVIFSGSTTSLKNVWMFLIAPLIGAVIAALVYSALHKEKEAK